MLRVGLGRRTLINRMTVPNPSFQLNFVDLGAGQVSTIEAASASTATFTRATAAWTKLSTGNWASVTSGTPRSFYSGMDTTVGIYAGYLAEGQRTNSALQARDQTATAWIKTNMTAAKDQTGIDGSANSCCSLTATAANGTAMQTVVLASGAKAWSLFAKRVTGTGDVAITLDGGATYTTVTPSINASTFTQVQATQTVATATVGIKLVTSGDKIALDMAQLEDGATFASTPMPTTTLAATRNADVLSYATTGWFNPTTGTLMAQLMTTQQAIAGRGFVTIDDGTGNNLIRLQASGGDAIQALIVAGSVTQAQLGATVLTNNVSFKDIVAYAANDFAQCTGGGALQTDSAGSIPVVTTIGIGVNISSPSVEMFGSVAKVSYYPIRLSNSVLQQLTT